MINTVKPVVVVMAGLLLAAPGPARADFADGLAAYDAGDYHAAYLAWLPLARRGDGDAQSAIAGLYLSELLIEPAGAAERARIRNTAVWWYRQAAECGHVIAQLNLGDLYATGTGVAEDPEQAWLWLTLAARGGNRWADDRRQEVERRMTAQQRVRAQAAVARWREAEHCDR